MAFIYDLNSELTAVTLRSGAAVTANNHSTGTSIASFKGGAIVALTSAAPSANEAASYTLNVFSGTASNGTGGTLLASFTAVTNAAASIQRIGIDTRNCNLYLSTQINIVGNTPTAYPIVVLYGTNSANG